MDRLNLRLSYEDSFQNKKYLTGEIALNGSPSFEGLCSDYPFGLYRIMGIFQPSEEAIRLIILHFPLQTSRSNVAYDLLHGNFAGKGFEGQYDGTRKELSSRVEFCDSPQKLLERIKDARVKSDFPAELTLTRVL